MENDIQKNLDFRIGTDEQIITFNRSKVINWLKKCKIVQKLNIDTFYLRKQY